MGRTDNKTARKSKTRQAAPHCVTRAHACLDLSRVSKSSSSATGESCTPDAAWPFTDTISHLPLFRLILCFRIGTDEPATLEPATLDASSESQRGPPCSGSWASTAWCMALARRPRSVGGWRREAEGSGRMHARLGACKMR